MTHIVFSKDESEYMGSFCIGDQCWFGVEALDGSTDSQHEASLTSTIEDRVAKVEQFSDPAWKAQFEDN